MVAGGCACLDSECLDSFWSSLEYTCNLCLFTQAWLFSVYNEQTWPFGTCLCLRLIRVIESSVARLWLPVLIAHLIPKSDQSHNMYLEFFLMKINNCHLRAVGGGNACPLQSGWRALTDLLEKQSPDSERHSTKASFGEVQVLHSIAN